MSSGGRPAVSPSTITKFKRFVRFAMMIIPVLIFALAAWVLYRLAQQIRLKDFLDSLHAVSTSQIALTVAATIASYLVITSYDALILRFLRLRLPYSHTASTVFIAASISASLGFNMLVSGPIRLRLYAAQGLSARDVGKIVLCGLVMYWSGFFCVGGTVFTFSPIEIPPPLSLTGQTVRAIGIALLVAVLGYLTICLLRVSLPIRHSRLAPPRGALAAVQLLVASLDWLLAGTVLYLILPSSHAGIGYVFILETYLVASSLGMLSHVPGGLGVLDAIILLFVGPAAGIANVAASLLLYRLIYYLCPFLGGIVTFASKEMHALVRRRQ
jgi:uncharacterized membrane protein YbhN (UPF0104 family)